jgi:UPF0042 nucleotide-binding protein
MSENETALTSRDGGVAVEESPRPTRVVLVTGMSGAGKSSALKALEDLGYEAVDNLPISLLDSLIAGTAARPRPLAIGVDIRTRDFAAGSVLQELDGLIRHKELDVRLLFLDCRTGVLQQRYSETRRRHPLAADRPVIDGIRHERTLVAPLRDRADLVLDTSDLTIADTRRALEGHFRLEAAPGLALFVTSFAYRYGVPREADLVFDVRFLANPHYEPEMRGLTGLDPAVGRFIAADPGYAVFFDALTALLRPLLPRFAQEGKSYLTIAIGCTGGKHRSVYVAERLAAWLAAEGRPAGVLHRDIAGAGRE